MKIWIILAAFAALFALGACAMGNLLSRIRELEDKITGIYHAIDRNNEHALRRCSDLEGRTKALEDRADEIEKELADEEAGGRNIERAIAKGLDNIFNYSLDVAVNGGAQRE